MIHQIKLRDLITLFWVVCFAGCGEWKEADDFQGRLRCGMEPKEVEALAMEMGVENFHPVEEPNAYTTHVMLKDRSFFEFYFADDGLETVRQGASVGPTTGTSYEPRFNLCTGEVTDYVELTLIGSKALAGASVFVDGEPHWRLATVPDYRLNIAVTNGTHEIRIDQKGYEPIVLTVHYEIGTETAELDLPEPKKQKVKE